MMSEFMCKLKIYNNLIKMSEEKKVEVEGTSFGESYSH